MLATRSEDDAEEPAGRTLTPTVAVVGAGFGGIAAGVKLKRAGIHTFTIYESSLGIGGTWWDNTYPGAEVDVGSHLYCFSFKPHDWTRTHARQPELQKYLEETVDEFGLRPHLQLGVAVESATWDDDRHVWTVRLDDGTVDECDVLVSAVGFLNVPRYPDWPGLDDFAGPAFHTARWEHEHDLTGKTVAVVGTGSSATQVVPGDPADRRAALRVPARAGVGHAQGRARPHRRAARRARPAVAAPPGALAPEVPAGEEPVAAGTSTGPAPGRTRRASSSAVDYIDRQFADRPDLRDAVTPKYPYPGKRPVFASTFYPALKKPNVELVPRAVASVTRTGIVDADGRGARRRRHRAWRPASRPPNYLARLRVVGRDGRTLQEHWAGEPRAYLGITVPASPTSSCSTGPAPTAARS